jgi:hypothetical protein
LRHSVEKSSESNLGEEIPEVVSPGGFFVFGFESSWKADTLFILNDSRVWKVHLSKQVGLKEKRIPVNSFAELPLSGGNSARCREKQLQFSAGTRKQCPSFQWPNQIEKICRSQDRALC